MSCFLLMLALLSSLATVVDFLSSYKLGTGNEMAILVYDEFQKSHS